MTLDCDTIQKDLKQWVDNYLDVPSDFYNGMKPCPYAKSTWERGGVCVLVGQEKTVMDTIDGWDDKFELVIVVYDTEKWSSNEWVQTTNKQIRNNDLYLMSFDPDNNGPDDPNLDPHEWGSVTEDVYGMVFVQRLSTLKSFSEKLKPTGYYEFVTDDFLAYVNERNELCEEEVKQQASDVQ